MDVNEIHRGRLIDHVQLVVRDLAASRRFYGAVFEVLGIPIGGEEETYFWADELFISSASSPPRSASSPAAITSPSRRRTAPPSTPSTPPARCGGRDNGPPGLRTYHPGYYAAFLIDPTATTSRPCSTASTSAARRRCW